MVAPLFQKDILFGLLYFATNEGKGKIPASQEILYHSLAKAVVEALGCEITPPEDRLYLPHEQKIKFKEFQGEEKTFKYFKRKKEEANFNGLYIAPRIDEVIENLLKIEEKIDPTFKKIRLIPLYNTLTLINWDREENSLFCQLHKPKKHIWEVLSRLTTSEIRDLNDIGIRLEAQILHDYTYFMRLS